MKNKFETERLILRAWQITDIADMVDGLNNYNVAKNLTTPFPYTIKDAEEFIEKIKKFDHKNYYFAIALKENNHAIGGCGIHFKEDKVGMGLWLNEKFHGKGYGTEALRRLAKYGFDELKIEQYNSGFLEGNTASCHMQQKIGSEISDKLEGEINCPARGGNTKEVKTVLTKKNFR